MSDETAREDACREYQSSLEDLTFNSKPHINMLTILAEENLHFAKDIVAIIEAQITKAPPAEKLPVLYLVDSIVKNVGGQYLEVFAKNLVTSFICVFEKVEENTRKSLFKLRSTWDEIFPLKKLYALDVRVNSVDPAWPIKPLPPNVNASIHVNPKFLKQTEEATPPRPSVQPGQQPRPTSTEKSLTKEQIIRQQLLAKQKQLLELQQKKIELELEQTKAQLAANPLVASNHPPGVAVVLFDAPPVANQTSSTQAAKPWPSSQSEKLTTRDPRLNRVGATVSHTKESVKKESQASGNVISGLEKRGHPSVERQSKLDKIRIPKKDTAAEEKSKSKSVSPSGKGAFGKNRATDPENARSAEVNKKDPRLRKQIHEKTDAKDEEVKEKKRNSDKKEREDSIKSSELQRSARGRLANGSLNKHDRHETLEKQEAKVIKASVRKRSRSRSRSPPLHSPKRKERRSPKRRTRSISPALKYGKGRLVCSKHLHAEEPAQHASGREERNTPKKSAAEQRRSKRSLEDRPADLKDAQQARASPAECKDAKRWRSGWEDNKHPKQPEMDLSHGKSGPQRHKPWAAGQRPPTPRTPKQHRLSVDANLQIPDVLNSASKRVLLKKASQRHADGKISQEEFLNVAHQINQLFQYQEEKQRSDSWDGSSDDAVFESKKKPPQTPGNMSDAQLSYLEHKSKLRRTQLQHPAKKDSPRGERLPHQRHDEEDASTGGSEIKNRYGGVFEAVKSSDSLRTFPGHEDPRKHDRPPSRTGPSIRNSPSPVNQDVHARKSPVMSFDQVQSPVDIELELPDGDISPRFESPNSVHSGTDLENDAPIPVEVLPRRDMISGQARGPQAVRKASESPGHTPPRPSDGSVTQASMQRFDGPNIPPRFDGPKPSLPVFDELPGHLGQSRSEGLRPHQSGRYEGNTGPGRYDNSGGSHGPSRFDGHSRYDSTHGPTRFERPPVKDRFGKPGGYDGPAMPHRPMRFGEPHGIGRFDETHPQQGSGRFDGPIGHQGRFDGQGPIRFDSPVPPNRFDGPARFDTPHMQPGPRGGYEGPLRYPGPIKYDGPHGPGPVRFDAPVGQAAARRFENPGQPAHIRFDGPGMPRYDCPPQQVPPRYCSPQNMQTQMRPQAQAMYDQPQVQGPLPNPSGSAQSNFNMSNRFVDPLNSFGGPSQPFPVQPNVSQGSNFNMHVPAASGFSNSYRPVAPFQGPVGNLSQHVNMMPDVGQPFIPSQVPFNQPGPQFAQPDSHLGQMDVNDLLSKLISTGIIKAPQTDSASSESSSAPKSQAAVEEEEEEEQEDDENIPDLTGFTIDDMKQRYESVITKLYTGIQCYSCGMRFTASQTDVYADHLDWHYRQNRSEKDISKKVTHRRWYYSLTDWIEFEEIADLEERAKSQFFEKVHEEVVQKTQEAAKEKEFQSVKAAPAVVDESCEICQEQFEMYWEEEEEEWHLKNAIRVDEKTYHPSCYEDYKNTSSFVDCTPSPSKMLTDNPLNAFIKQEPGDETSCCSIKDEPDTETTEAVTVKEEVQVKLEGDSQSSAIIF